MMTYEKLGEIKEIDLSPLRSIEYDGIKEGIDKLMDSHQNYACVRLENHGIK